jgi:hypothetical protein
MSWQLTSQIAAHGLKLNEAMSLLQSNGVISDNSIELEDIGLADSASGCRWLDNHPVEIAEVIANRVEDIHNKV